MTSNNVLIERILDAFDFLANGAFIYPENCTESHMKQLDEDAKFIRDRYEQLKWNVGFASAMHRAKHEYMTLVLAEEV